MKAFLSHSSKDKHFVREVAKNLGNLQIEYDEYTFEYVLNLLAPYFIRAEILMALNDIPGVEKDLQEIDGLLEKSGATKRRR